MRFDFDPNFVSVAFKAEHFAGSMAVDGPPCPEGILIALAMDAQARFFSILLRDDEGREYVRQYPFGSVRMEDGGPSRLSRIDVTGTPGVAIYGDIVKGFYANYRQGGEAELWRFNTGYKLIR